MTRTKLQLRQKGSRSALAFLLAVTLVATQYVLPDAEAAARPDLIVASVSRVPSFRTPGAKFTITDKVKNVGGKSARRSTTKFYLSSDGKRGKDIALQGARKVPSLGRRKASGGSTKLTVPASTPTYVYFILACADATHRVREANEKNNCKVAPGRILIDTAPPDPNPLNVGFSLGAGQVSETITRDEGGTLHTTGSDGTVYDLDIPARSLLKDTEITMTTIASLTHLPEGNVFENGLGGGVQLEPHGLHLYKGATLTITPATGAPEGTLRAGFAFAEDGEQFHFYPWKAGTSSIELHLTHFSGYGVGDGTPAELAALADRIPLRDHIEFQTEHSLGDLMIELEEGNLTPEEFSDKASTLLIKDFLRNVVPIGQAAMKDDADEHEAREAVEACFSWGRQVDLLDLMDHASPDLGLKPRVLWNECLKQIERIAKKRFDLAHERCLTNGDPDQLDRMRSWARLAELQLSGGATDVLGTDYLQKIHACMGPAEGFTGTISGEQEGSFGFRAVWDATVTFEKGGFVGTTDTVRYPLHSGTITITIQSLDQRSSTECSVVDGTETFTLTPKLTTRIEVGSSGLYGGLLEGPSMTGAFEVPITVDCGHGPQDMSPIVPHPNSTAHFLWRTPQGVETPRRDLETGALVGTHSLTKELDNESWWTQWSWNLVPVSN